MDKQKITPVDGLRPQETSRGVAGTPTNEQIVKRALFLAYQASRVVGMGILSAQDGVTEEMLWEPQRLGWANADYAYGRMMKFSLRYNDKSIEPREGALRSDYQSWCREYPTYQALLDAARQSLQAQGDRV